MKYHNKINISKQDLLEYYFKKGLTTYKIAEIYKCNPETIRRSLIKYGIKRKKYSKINISREEFIKLYHKEKLSTLSIAKEFNCCQSSVWEFMVRNKIKRRSSSDFLKWRSPGNSKNPILEESPTISYILGVLLGDGWIYKYECNYSINLECKDKIFCEVFAEHLKQIKLNPCIIKNGGYWRTTATSKEFYLWAKDLKSNFNKIEKIALKWPVEFLKGFYESEGSVCLVRYKGYTKYYPRLCINNTNKDYIFLNKKLLNKLGFNPTLNLYGPYPNYSLRKPLWTLRLNRKKEIFNFLELIKPVIKNLNQNNSFINKNI